MLDLHRLRLLAHLPGALWRRLKPEQQRNIKSFSWAFSTHFLLIIILAIIIFPGEPDQHISIVLSLTNQDSSVAEFTIAEDFEEAEEVIESLATLEEPVPVALPEPVMPPVEEFIEPPELAPGELERDQPQAASESSQDAALNPESQALATETERRVREAGGSTEGRIIVSLMYDGVDDLDLAVTYQVLDRESRMSARRISRRAQRIEQMTTHLKTIWYGNSYTEHGRLDVDANAAVIAPEPCENIVFTELPERAQYKVFINHFRARQRGPTPYVVVVTIDGMTRVYEGSIRHGGGLRAICEFQYP